MYFTCDRDGSKRKKKQTNLAKQTKVIWKI